MHLVTIKPYLYGGIIARLTNVPSVVTAIAGLGSLFIRNSFKNIFIRTLIYPIYKVALGHSNQMIIVQNKDDAKLLIKWGVLNSKKTKLLKGSGVDLNKFIIRKEPKGIPVVCFAGRLLKDKGVMEFVEAARIIKKKGINARFILAGKKDLSNPTGINTKEIKNFKDEKIVEVLGYKKNISALLYKSNIVCLPSYREGFPKILAEAAASSRPIITTNVPGCRDAIIPNKSGLLVPVKNSIKLANVIKRLINNRSERIAMGKAGRKLAEKEFRIEKIIKAHLKIYQKLFNNFNRIHKRF